MSFDNDNILQRPCRDINVKLAFKQVNKSSPLINKIICFGTKGKFYHVEIIIGDLWISSDSDNGVHIKNIDNLEGWVIKDLGARFITEEHYQCLISWLLSKKGKKYDFLAVYFNFIFKYINLNNKNKWFCSEIVTKILQLLLFKEVLDLTPDKSTPAILGKIFDV